jgi:WD40 repeat protein
MNFRLCVPGYDPDDLHNPVWSPDGTQIACDVGVEDDIYRLVIFDQRRGLLRFRRHGDDGENNDEIGWITNFPDGDVPELKFSPDGSFLISSGNDYWPVKIWDYNTTDGYCLQLQDWNINQELDEDLMHSIQINVSPCCRHIVVVADRNVLLKDVQSNGKTIKSVLLLGDECVYQLLFSTIVEGHHSIFICSKSELSGKEFMKIWRPYAIIDEDDPDSTASFMNILEKYSSIDNHFALSHDKSMLAIYLIGGTGNVMLYSIDYDNKFTTFKQYFSARCAPIRFTPDDNYISYSNENRLAFWNIATGRETADQVNITYKKN